MIEQAVHLPRRSWFAIATGFVLVLAGLPLVYWGGILISLGGSAYYLPIGIGLVISGVLLGLQRSSGAALYAALYGITLLWAVAEVGLDFWRLSPRIVAPTFLLMPVLLSLALLQRRRRQMTHGLADRAIWTRIGFVGAAAAALLLTGFGIAAIYPHGAQYGAARAVRADVVTASGEGDWTAYGRTNEGRRFAPFTQIDKANVGQLQVAWTAHTGDIPSDTGSDEHTPLQIGDKLIGCTPRNIINAFDAETGRILWTFDPRAKGLRQRCRGVSYFAETGPEGGEAAGSTPAACRERIIMTTIDARLIALDLRDGKPCRAFGQNGTVDLKAGLGEDPSNYYFLTSAPTVANGLIVVGGLVMDNPSVDMPSGVVRAFDATSGALRWVWDLGQTDPNAMPGKGTIFTRGTPNVWAPPSVDEKLGLVFLPTGNPAPDHWGGNRSPAMDRFSSSVVALELATGKLRWSFQTTHHDLWDYDVPSQPTLYDMPDGRGGRVPALIQPTKRGEIFVLDRRTGKPIAAVEERQVPQGRVTGDHTSPTQPYSVGMPTISAPRITETEMWGLSPIDQLWCRVTFRKLRYDGDFTPPGIKPGLLFPGVFGGMNWGSASIDEANDYLIVNDIRVGDMLALVPRAEADRDGKKVLQRLTSREITPGHGGLFIQKGAPYAAMYAKFMSPLGLPCQAPPFGTLTAIDLKSREIAWQVPMGTTRDTGPLGIRMHLPMPVGLPTIGGSLVTKSGLIFFAGTQDFYLRAIDSATGREVWKGRLPVGAGATPMTFISPRSKRQFIVIAASGSRQSTTKGDLLIAYALPAPAGPSRLAGSSTR